MKNPAGNVHLTPSLCLAYDDNLESSRLIQFGLHCYLQDCAPSRRRWLAVLDYPAAKCHPGRQLLHPTPTVSTIVHLTESVASHCQTMPCDSDTAAVLATLYTL